MAVDTYQWNLIERSMSISMKGHYYCHISNDVALYRRRGGAPYVYFAATTWNGNLVRTDDFKTTEEAIAELDKLINELEGGE